MTSMTHKPRAAYQDPRHPGPEQTRLAAVSAADGVARVETLLNDPGDQAVMAMIGLLEQVVENQRAVERRVRRCEQALGLILRQAGLHLPPGLEAAPSTPPSGPPAQSPRK